MIFHRLKPFTKFHTRTNAIIGCAVFWFLSACAEQPDYRFAFSNAPTNEKEADELTPSPDQKNITDQIKDAFQSQDKIQIWPLQPCVVSFSCAYPDKKATLRDIIWYGASVNPKISAALAREKAANADVRAALYAFGPTPSIALTADYLTFELTQPLFSGGSLKILLESARKQAEIAASDVHIEQLKISAAIAEAYMGWMAAYLLEQVWKDALAAQTLIVESLERRVEAGISNKNEFTQAQGMLISTRREIFSAEVNRERALNELNVIIGTPIPEKAMVSGISIEVPTPSPLDESRITMLETNPIIAQAKIEVEKAQINVRAARLRLWPTFSIVGRHRSAAPNSSITTPSITDNYLSAQSNFGAALSSQARINATQAGVDAAQENLSATRRNMVGSMEQDYVLLKSSLENKSAAQKLVETSQNLLASNQRQYASGTKRWNDVIISVQEVANAKALEIDSNSAALLSAWRINIFAKTPYGL